MKRKAIIPLALLALLPLTACGSAPAAKGSYGAPPRSFDGFPSLTNTNIEGRDAHVNVEATYVSAHGRMLGTDLIKKGIVPIRLRLGLRGENMSNAQISVELSQLNARMYLPDGSILLPADGDDLEKAAGKTNYTKKVAPNSLTDHLLEEWEFAEKKDEFVFFKLKLDKPQLNGTKLSFLKDGAATTVDLKNALITFNVMLEQKRLPYSIGINSKSK